MINDLIVLKKKMRAVGFEPTPLSRLAPEASALDHSAKLPFSKN